MKKMSSPALTTMLTPLLRSSDPLDRIISPR